ncbi:MAG: hypothetical protein LQ351_005622 [Letrouitia transgressa]|nr:MAG: hypothetical protein LQ351_005622 [Letrouitia transgressa]
MITSCSHTFCSLCIRRCLNIDGQCPACRTPDQALRLRQNWTVQELVDAFQSVRPILLRLGQDANSASLPSSINRKKRKAGSLGPEGLDYNDVDVPESRITRSQTRKDPTVEVQHSDQNSGSVNEKSPQLDGLAACPICEQRMREEDVFNHLDTHNSEDQSSRVQLPRHDSPSLPFSAKAPPVPKPPERLPQINYSLMKDNALRKKLSEHGIPNDGSRAALTQRHAEWVNIVNANADSARPRSRKEMLRELDIWERTQGRHTANGLADSNNSNHVMSKDFDSSAWASSHSKDFQDLISKAQQNKKASASQKSTNAQTPSDDALNTQQIPPDPSNTVQKNEIE